MTSDTFSISLAPAPSLNRVALNLAVWVYLNPSQITLFPPPLLPHFG
jgi:hypothetical protein